MTEPPPTKKQRIESPSAQDAATMQTEAELQRVETPATSDPRVRRLLPVPFVNPYNGGDFYYDRECYDEYYKRVEGLLQSGEPCVTVTGSPGIGKSVFSAYFADRYLKTHSDVWIVAAASMTSHPTQLVLLGEENEPVSPDDDEDLMAFARKAARRAKNAGKSLLWLHNGPPGNVHGVGQYVVFTSPHEGWLRAVHKLHCTYYMPPWTRDELHEAALLLGLKLSWEEIDSRFDTFGGNARYCLHPSSAAVKKETNAVNQAIEQIANHTEVRTLVLGTKTTETRHRLIHYKPHEKQRGIYTTDVASPFLGQKLADQTLQWRVRKRAELRSWMTRWTNGTCLHQWIFKAETHHALCQGRWLQLLPLVAGALMAATGTETVTLEKTDDSPVESGEATIAVATRRPYHKLEVKNLESVDSFYLPRAPHDADVTEASTVEWDKRPENRLLLFHITASETPRVNAAGLIHVLNHLDLLESVAQNPSRVALVFVVPRAKVASFTQQQQTITEATFDRSDRLCSIRGIDSQKAAELTTKLQIEDMATLQEKMLLSSEQLELTSEEDKKWWTEVCDLGLKHGLTTKSTNYSDVVAKIPQYVCSWEEAPAEPQSVASMSREIEELKAENQKLSQQIAALRARLQVLIKGG